MRKAVVVGVVWGLFCGIGNGWPVATTLVQMAVPWIWVAAFVAYRAANSGRRAALLGGIGLLAANVAYFAIGSIGRGFAGLSLVGGIGFFALWATVGLVIGPVAGVVGWWLKSERTSFVAVVMLATVSIAEHLALWAHIDHFHAHLAYLSVAAAGVAFPLIWFRRERRNALKSLALVMILTYPSAVFLEATLIALDQISPPMRLV
jgi:hypothetical protein